jgi:hypothetical protein
VVPGHSWITAGLGYAVIVLTWLNQVFVEQGIPHDGKGWITFLLGNVGGLIGVFAKDFNKSNAPKPDAAAHPVPPV